MKISIQTLGCKVNQSESAAIEGTLRNSDYEIVHHNDKPDVCIINTCTVTAKSDGQSRQLIRKAARSGVRVIATGCYAQLRANELSKIEGIDLILGNSEKGDILNYLQKLNGTNGTPLQVLGHPDSSLKCQPYYSTRSRAFLKIQDGCNFSCSYCAVPQARGKSRSLSQPDITDASRRLVSDGYKEIVLTGIHIGSYGTDLKPKSSLLDVVKHLAEEIPQIRIRLSSIEPQEFKSEFLKYIKDGYLCRHLHIPIQSGSDKILRLMNRGYTVKYYKQLINSIITACPDVSVGTDVVVGFPGESDNDFYDTVNIINNLPLSYLHIFPYSKRPNTKASLLDNQISEKIKKERVKYLLGISEKKKKDYMIRNLGEILEVIVERKSTSNQYYHAISDNYLRLLIKSSKLTAGDKLKVRVISLTDSRLTAEPLK